MTYKLFSAIVVLFTPLIIVTLATCLTAQPWFIVSIYKRHARSIFKEHSLALTGLRAITPGGKGVELLRKAKLYNGKPAFNEREISHMADVRRIFHILFLLTLAGISFICIILFFGRSREKYYALLWGVKYGAMLTLGILTAALLATVFDFDTFFLKFHYLFFEGESFLFNPEDTLIQLYPEWFWKDAALLVGSLCVTVSAFLMGIAWHLLKDYPKKS